MKPITSPFMEGTLKGPPLLAVAIMGCSAGFLLFGYDQGIASKSQGTVSYWPFEAMSVFWNPDRALVLRCSNPKSRLCKRGRREDLL